VSKIPCTLGENDYRIVVKVGMASDYPYNLEVSFSGGIYNTGNSFHDFKTIEEVIQSVLHQLDVGYECGVLTSVNLTMTSPTDEERDAVMRVWNEWQDEQKEVEDDE